jgi:hypothetical protein
MDEYDYAAAYDRLNDRQRMDILIVIPGSIGLGHAEDTLAIRIAHAVMPRNGMGNYPTLSRRRSSRTVALRTARR